MTTVEYVISALCALTLGLIAVIWWILQQYINNDKQWKIATDKQLYRHFESINSIEHSMKSIRAAIKGEVGLVELKLSQVKSDISEMNDDFKALRKRFNDQKSDQADWGRVLILEDKINAIFSVIKKAKKPNQ